MRIRIDRDEFSLLLAAQDVGDIRDGPIVTELPAAEFVDYQRVRQEYENWQRRLEALANDRPAQTDSKGARAPPDLRKIRRL